MKTPPRERSIELSTLELLVEASSSAELDITWTPQEIGSWRDTLQLLDSRRTKYDVALVTTATGAKKTRAQGRSKVLGDSNVNRSNAVVRSRRTSPPATSGPKKNANSTSLSLLNVPSKRPRLNVRHENKENSTKLPWTYEPPVAKTKNFSPTREPHDFSAIMNSTKFNLTPVNPNSRPNQIQQAKIVVTETTKEILFSPHQAGILSPENTINPLVDRRQTYTAAKYCKDIVIKLVQPDDEEDENFVDSLSPQPDGQESDHGSRKKPSDFSLLIDNMNLMTPKTPANHPPSGNFSPKGCSTGHRTKSITETPTENDQSRLFVGNDTFDVSTSSVANNSRANGTYELSTSPTRSAIIDPIKPTRLSRSFGTMSPVIPSTSLEAGKPGLSSSSPLCPEAISSRREYSTRISLGHSSQRNYDDASVKEVLEADLWAKADSEHSNTFTASTMKTRCMSLEIIDEEPSSTRFDRTKTMDLPSTTAKLSTKVSRIEISPPKKYSSGSRTAPIRRVSPTKGTKIRKDKSALEPAASLRKKVQMNCSIKRGKVSIPGVRIANLSLAGLTRGSNAAKDKSTRNEPKEVSVKLHDPNDFVTRLCNPDPFGATMTQDPFLTSTLYYDDKWMHHQEMEFKKWLNALLTPPEHLSGDVDTIRVDVGKVWQSCRAKEDVALAETREAVSARYHTNTRLNTLRKAACAMFRREEVTTALSKATVCIERGTLMIRQDRDLHRDIGLQKEILELFLSYNPLWLRIGLETVYGETIPLHSNNDLVGLTRFLISRFFADPFIVKTHSHSTTTSLKMPSFAVQMNKFILKKFILIVYFLDYAKRNKLIGHDPCLFHKRAPHKESRAILLNFSREVLAGVGDVTKVLRAHGYVVSHKQTYLDEYDYAVNDIAVDLRDGVRLCRVMELITGGRNLTCRCRVPAISRLQKVHNVDVALSALLRCGYTLTGDIDGKSIADGHREKTLSLLWQIIYKYQAPRFEKAAKLLQRWWRAKLWYVRVRNFLRRRKDDAASTIQRAWRCHQARQTLDRLRSERDRLMAEKESAVRKIQLLWIRRRRMMSDRNKYLVARTALLRIQRWYRRARETAPFVDDFRRKRQSIVTIQRHWRAEIVARKQRKNYLDIVRACTTIQSWWRTIRAGREVCRRYRAVRTAAVLIQSKWRARRLMITAREAFRTKLSAVRAVQSWWRGVLALKRDRNDYLLLKHAARTIEAWWIGQSLVRIHRNEFERTRRGAVAIQRWWRRRLETRDDVSNFRESTRACRTVQQWWRSARVAKTYKLQKKSCLTIQRWWRGVVATRAAVASFSNHRRAAITLQKTLRMKMARRNFVRTRKAILTIHSWYSNVLASRAVRRDFVKKRDAVLTIQRWWRSWKVTWELQNRYLEYRRTVITVQTRWRSNDLAKRTRRDYLGARKAATRIQASWRMTRDRRSYVELLKRKRAAMVLQRRWRETLLARKARKVFVEYRSAVVVVQHRYRALRIGRAVREQYLEERRAAIVLQKNWRMLRAAREYETLREAAMALQSRWRSRKLGMQTRQRYLALRKATIDFQHRYRAKVIGAHTRHSYLQLRQAALIVQRRFRANRLMWDDKKRFVEYRRATIVVQSRWRMFVEMKNYRLKRRAALAIQSRWRARAAGRKSRSDYLKLRESVVAVQRRYRANVECRIAREEYTRVRGRIIWLQNAWRKKLENRMREEAAINIQTWWRAILSMRLCRTRFESQKDAALVLQRRFRARRLGQEARREFARVVLAIGRIQRTWRRFARRRRHEEWLRDCKEAVLVIENWWTRVLERKRVREAELALLSKQNAAATKIQTAWRGHRVRMLQCETMKELRKRSERAAKTAVPTATVAFQMQESMNMFLVCDTIGQLSMCLVTLGTYC